MGPAPARCSFMSTSAAARYSTVSNPWLNLPARSIFATSDRGMGLPVRTCRAKRESTSGVGSHRSRSCEGNST